MTGSAGQNSPGNKQLAQGSLVQWRMEGFDIRNAVANIKPQRYNRHKDIFLIELFLKVSCVAINKNLSYPICLPAF